MENVTILGIDLAKNIFQIHGNNQAGKAVLRKKLRRQQFANFVGNFPRCTIAMEACTGAHFWARKFTEMGHEVKLISPQYVKPYVKTNKSDQADAEAIAEAAVRPNMHFVPIKTDRQMDLSAMHRVRRRLVKNRTALLNEIRGLLAERGIVAPQGPKAIKKSVVELIKICSSDLTSQMKITLTDLYQEVTDLEERLAVVEKRLISFAKKDEQCKRLQTVPGVGVITATAIVAAIPDPNHFKNGRQFAAWLGLVPRHSGTGGKNKVLGISKRGDAYLRTLLIQGALAVTQHARSRDNRLNRWILDLLEKKTRNKVHVALANKNARIIINILKNETEYMAAA